MPKGCPACWLNLDDGVALTAALLCGESFYSIGKRFGLTAMSVSRHLDNHLLGISVWRQYSLEYGPRRIRKQLIAFMPVAADEITAWLRGDRPTKIMPKPDLREIEKIDRQLKALGKSIR